MADIIHNLLIVQGKEKDLLAFHNQFSQKREVQVTDMENPREQKVHVQAFSFGNFVHITEEEQQKDNWYEAHIEKWSTKWDSIECMVAVDLVNETIIYQFDSAWNPPFNVYNEMIKQYPSLKFDIWAIEERFTFGSKDEIYLKVRTEWVERPVGRLLEKYKPYLTMTGGSSDNDEEWENRFVALKPEVITNGQVWISIEDEED